jgi:hypothetical protein
MLAEKERPLVDNVVRLDGPRFHDLQLTLARFNRTRLTPAQVNTNWRDDIATASHLLELEGAFIEAARSHIAPLATGVPRDAKDFVAWFEDLRESGPGQGDPLFPFLAERATREQMKWFLEQEVAGEAGFDDLLALTQVKMPERAKLEMARNYWDEMGRGASKGMHGPMLARLAHFFGIVPQIETTVPEALALNNVMMALACNRRYAFHSVGALGAIEMTAPTRTGFVNAGLRRLGVPKKECHYFALHTTLDIAHSRAWNAEVLMTLVEEDSRRVTAIAEGALLRLWCGKRCFDRYREILL